MGGYGDLPVWRQNARASEGTVLPRDSISGYLGLPYDDTGGYEVGAALANLSTGPAIVTVRDQGRGWNAAPRSSSLV